MNIIVVGCGRVGAELAYRLFQRGNAGHGDRLSKHGFCKSTA